MILLQSRCAVQRIGTSDNEARTRYDIYLFRTLYSYYLWNESHRDMHVKPQLLRDDIVV